jgi:outer membrane protein TolC
MPVLRLLLMLYFIGTLASSGWSQSSLVPAQSAVQGNGQAAQAQRGLTGATSFLSNAGQSPVLGGIPTGTATPGVIPLSLSEVLKRGLQYNLGIALSTQSIRAARGARLVALSELLPRLTMGLRDAGQQTNLEALGFQGFPGMPTVIGPYNVFDVRAFVTQSVLNFPALNRWRAQGENIKAAEFSDLDARDLVVFVCGNLYMQAVASSSRIDATRAQVATAQALYNLALDQKAAGVVPGIEVLRSQVELQAQQQRLIVAEDQFAKDKLTLARAIGLPLGQEFSLAEGMPYTPFPAMSLEDAMARAYLDRPDYQSVLALVRAAESTKRAASAGRLPSLDFGADYGISGQRPWDSHGTFTVLANLRIPIFQGRLIEGQVEEAEALLRQRQAQAEDLRGRIYYDVRNAFLDLKAADDRVQVAQSAIKLADEQVSQAQDRFGAGVASNIEVVQAQEALASASENYISSLFAHSTAKLALARALGASSESYEQFLRGK